MDTPGHPNRMRSSKDRRGAVGKGDRARPVDKEQYDRNYEGVDWDDGEDETLEEVDDAE